jgi:hypothetical protein
MSLYIYALYIHKLNILKIINSQNFKIFDWDLVQNIFSVTWGSVYVWVFPSVVKGRWPRQTFYSVIESKEQRRKLTHGNPQ